jgi:hypothetical protein
MERKFPALRIIGTIYKVLGVIAGLGALLTAIGICVTAFAGGAAADTAVRQFGGDIGFGLFGGVLSGLIFGGVVLLYGAVISVTMYGLGEMVFLLITLEENTRTTARLLEGRVVRADVSPPQPPGV